MFGGHCRRLGALAQRTPNGHAVLVSSRPEDDVPTRVVACILRDHDKVLLCHRHPEREWYPNVWDLPGGHIEAGEHPAEALVRELVEELGVALPRPVDGPFRQVIDVGIEMTIWLIDYYGSVMNTAPDEHDELRWFTSEEIPTLDLAHHSYVEMLGTALGQN